MSNRHERRAAKARGMLGLLVSIDLGRCSMERTGLAAREEAYPECFACGKDAKQWAWPDCPAKLGFGIAKIQVSGQAADVFLCETCFNSDDVSNIIARKLLNAPDLEISEAGEATLEHVLEIGAAVSESHDATEH